MADNIVIPVESYPEQLFRIELDGIPCTMRIYWSAWNESIQAIMNEEGGHQHLGCWYLDISASDFTINGIAITQGCDLLEPYAQSELGGLFVGNVEKKDTEITFGSLGTEHVLVYILKDNLPDYYELIGYA